MTIWWSLLLNLVAYQIKSTILIVMVVTDSPGNSSLASYAIGSIACFFFTNATVLQVFEWDLLAKMVQF